MKGLTAPKRKSINTHSQSSPSPNLIHGTSSTPAEASTLDSQNDLPGPLSGAQEHGFLGSTAYNAPFAENEERMALEYDSYSSEPDFGERLHEEITAKQRGIHHVDHRVKEAMRVLKFLQDFPSLENMINLWDKENQCTGIMALWMESAVSAIRNDLWDNGCLESEKSMMETIHRLFQNTSKRIIIKSDMKFGDLMEQFAGDNIRWETLAIFMTGCGLAISDMYSDFHGLKFTGGTESSRQSLHYNLYEMSNACVTFCDELGCMNDVYLIVQIENCVLVSQVLGDSHHLVWRKVGDMSTAIFAGGIHQQNKTNLPFWLCETRRRCLGIAYALDKSLCMFLGRPPRIAKRYCKIEIPLDLDDRELILEGPALEEVLNNLRPDGWSTKSREGKSPDAGWTRPFIINALIREEVLEICLGPPQDDLRERAMDLIRRNGETHKSMPMTIDSNPGQWASREVSPSWHAVNLYLESKYNDFLVHRTLVRQLRDEPDELLQLAHLILTAVIEVRNIRGILPSRLGCVQWLAVLYGLPCAGVLALELMQLNSKGLSHTKVAQDLCVFISYLRWIHVPGDGNFQLVERARRTLQKILDKCMEMPRQKLNYSHLGRSGSQQLLTPTSDTILWPEPVAMNDFFWFDTEQLDPSLWANLNTMELPTAT